MDENRPMDENDQLDEDHEAFVESHESVTKDERTMAFLSYLLAAVIPFVTGIFGFIGPLIIFLANKDKKFVRFHSLQALGISLISIPLAVAMFVAFDVADYVGSKYDTASADGFALVMLSFCIICAAGSLGVIILQVMGCLKAKNNEWYKFPLLGDFVMEQFV